MRSSNQTLGEALREKRTKLGISQVEAAEILGANQGNYSRWERDLIEPRDPLHFEALSKFLDISMKELAGLVANSALQRTVTKLDLLRSESKRSK